MEKKTDKFSVENLLGVSRSYLINLDRREDRLENFMKNIKEKGLLFDNLERFSAVDAKKLDDQYINSIIDVSARKGAFGEREYHEELNGRGSVGCYLSHVTLWKRCVELNQPILIMEDDINFVDGFMEKLEKISEYLPRDGLTLFNYQFNTRPEKENEYIFKVKHFFGLGFYTITPEFIKKILDFLFPIKYQIDSVLSFLSPFVNIYAVEYEGKPLVYQNDSKSDAQSVAKVESFKYLNGCTNSNKYRYIVYILIISIIIYLIYKNRNFFEEMKKLL